MEHVCSLMGKFDACVATTGFAGRELYELRKRLDQPGNRDFLCVGSMGHASSIAMGVALGKPSKHVYVLDGDGAMLMHMGAIPQIGCRDIPNLKHIMFNNESHDSVGGQPTVAASIDIPTVVKACGYKYVGVASTPDEIAREMEIIKNTDGPVFLEIKVNRSTRKDLGRPKETPKSNKERFIQFLDS